MKLEDLKIGNRYRIHFDGVNEVSTFHGIGILKAINPPEYNEGALEFFLPDDSIGMGVFDVGDIVEAIIDPVENITDTARLDWLAKQASPQILRHYETGEWGIAETTGGINDPEFHWIVECEYETMRDALDAAMLATRKN